MVLPKKPRMKSSPTDMAVFAMRLRGTERVPGIDIARGSFCSTGRSESPLIKFRLRRLSIGPGQLNDAFWLSRQCDAGGAGKQRAAGGLERDPLGFAVDGEDGDRLEPCCRDRLLVLVADEKFEIVGF